MYKVLIADDEPMILKGLSSIVDWNEFGFEIAEQCANGLEAVAALERQAIDILITDIKMPELDGIELIRHIKSRRLSTRCIVLSGHDDFGYVKEAALLGIENYLLKPFNMQELLSTMENAKSKIENELHKKIEENAEKHILRNNILYRWMTDDIDTKELESRAELLDIELYDESYLVAIIKLVYVESKSRLYRIADKKLLKYAAHNICCELAGKAAHSLRVATLCDLNGDIVFLFAREVGPIAATDVEPVLQGCMEQVKSLLGIDVFATIGSQQTNYKQLHLSYAHARNLQEFRLVFPYNRLVRYGDAGTLTDGGAAIPSFHFYAFRDCIADRDREQTIRLVEELRQQLMDGSEVTPSHVRNAALELLFTIKNTLNEFSANTENFYNDNRELFQRLYKFELMEEMIDCLKEIALHAIGHLERNDERASPFIQRIVQHIHQCYAQNIDLQQVAAAYKINPLYLGQLFKKETGDTFTNCMNKVRIEKAKELLLETSLKTYEIAEQVGYVNVNYFPTIFKKLVGESPSEFQRRQLTAR